METVKKSLPEPVLRRLPRYLIYVRELENSGDDWVSSVSMASALGLTSSTVRQDLSHLDLEGVSKRGYEVSRLLTVLDHELGGSRCHRVLIAGAGHLGSALALHGSLANHGFEVSAIVDNDPDIIGTQVGSLTVHSLDDMPRLVKELEIDIGMIAVPAAGAQQVANRMMESGLTALLNLALIHLHAAEGVTISDARIVVRLQELAYDLRNRNQ